MILSDRSIKEAIVSGRLGIDPFDPRLVQPSSVDVRLDNKFLVFRNTKRAYIDVKQPAEDLMEMLEVGLDEPMFLHPHEFVLGSTIERVRMPVDLVARLEGRSSLGRLGVVIHSSLPYDEPVLFLDDAGVLDHRPIGEIVERRLSGEVVAFDRDTFEVGFHRVTDWFRELPDKIYEVRLASGRRVHVTAGHNLFTLDGAGNLVKTPTGALRPGTPVALPKWIPDPGKHGAAPEYHVLDLLSDDVKSELLCHGPTVDIALERREADTRQLLREAGLSVGHHLRGRMLPVRVLQQLEGCGELRLGPLDRLRFDGDAASLPAVVVVDGELAWLLGVYVAHGGRRAQQITIASADQSILDRAAAALDRLGPGIRRSAGEVACGSRLASAIFEALAMGDSGPTRRLPRGALGWPRKLLDSLLAGLLHSPQQDQPRRSPGRGSDGSEPPELDCLWTTSPELVSEVLLASSRLGKPAVSQTLAPRPGCARSYVVSIARNRHSVLTGEPNPRRMPIDSPHALGASQVATARLRGLGDTTSSNTVEVARNRRVERIETLLQIRSTDATPGPGAHDPIQKLTRLVNGLVQFDKVTEVVDTGRFETVYDLEVRSDHAHIENFLAGYGGLFVSNTAGFIDPAFEGHVTLEISNLANLPIALYPGMRIGQLSFSLMTTPAERPYGPSRGSKYTGQDLPTASRLYLDFQQQPQ